MHQEQEPSSSTQGSDDGMQSRPKRRHTKDSDGQAKRKKVDKVVLSEKELCNLAKKLGKDWKTLALQLDFSMADIENIMNDNSSSIVYTITTMLCQWRNKNEVAGICWKLGNHLKDIGRNDLAREVLDNKLSNAQGQPADMAYNSMLMKVEDGLSKKLLKKAKRYLRAPSSFPNAESLMNYLHNTSGLRRTNVCILQTLLFYLDCKDLLKIVEDFGRENDYVVFLFEAKPNQDTDIGHTRVQFKLKCSPTQLSRDELDALLIEIRNFMHMDVECAVKGVSEGCTCLMLDIPYRYIPTLRTAALERSATLTDLGIFKVIIGGEDLPDLCPNFQHEPSRMLLPDITSETKEVSEQFRRLAEEFKDKWFEVGTQLQVPTNKLHKIKKTKTNDNQRAYEMLLAWRECWDKHANYSEKLQLAKSLTNSCPNCSCPGIHRCSSPAFSQQSLIVPPRGAVVRAALKNILTAKYRELDQLDPNFGNPIHHNLADNYIEIDLKQKQDRRPVKLNAILENVKETRKVLIQGRAGFGKTTVCKKLVHDWATSRDVVFGSKIPLFVKVHEITSDHIIPACQGGILKQAIFPRLVPLIVNFNLTHDEIWLFIQSNSSEFVFILDGLDEASGEVLDALAGLLNGAYLPYSTIIATSTSDNLENDVHIDCHLVLEGFSEAQIKECVKNSFKNRSDDGDLFLNEIKKSNLMEFMECPLFAVLLSLMWQEASYRKIHRSLPSTWTDLLKHFCMFLVRRHERKEKGRKSGYFDTFHNMPPSYHTIMANIGKLALDALKKNSLMFQVNTKDGIVAESIGLIIKSTIVTPLKVIPSYVTIHKVILEFLAAVYLKSISEPYPTELLVSKRMKMVTLFLTGLLDAECKASDLLKSFVEENQQNYELAADCLKECTNKQKVLKELGGVVSKHTYLDLGFIGKESTDVLQHLYSMLEQTKPLMIMKIEASAVFFSDDHSAVVFAKLVKCIPELIALNLPRFMLSSQLCSFVNELERGSNKRRCTSLQKISLVSDVESTECSDKVVQMLTLFPHLNELVLQVKMNAEASSKFLTGVGHHITGRGQFLEKVKILDVSLLTLSEDKDCENMVSIFSELQTLQRLIIPRQVLTLLYPRYYRDIPFGKYILHKMPVLPNVKLSVFLQIDAGQFNESPNSSSIELLHNPLSFPDLPSEALSVPDFLPASPSWNTSKLKMSKNTVCDLLETSEGVLVLTYWNSVLGYQRALNQSDILMLSPFAVCLHSFTSGNAKLVAELVTKIMPKEIILNDSSCASLATFYKVGHVTMDGIVTADLTECSLVEKAADAILTFPNLETVHMTETMNPVSLLQELDSEMNQRLPLKLKLIHLSLSLESSFDVLKSVSIQFNDVCVSPCSITLNSPNFNGISILLEKDPTLLTHLPWVKRIQFEGDHLKFLTKLLMLLDRSADCFKNLSILKFAEGEFVDEKANEIMEDVRSKIPHLVVLLKKQPCSTNPERLLTTVDELYQRFASQLRSVGNMYDEVCLSSSQLRLTRSCYTTATVEEQNHIHDITLPSSDPKLLIEVPHIRKLTIKPVRDGTHLFISWIRALDKGGVCYEYLQTLDLQGTKFKSPRSLQTFSKVKQYTPNLSLIMNAKVKPAIAHHYKQFLIENEISETQDQFPHF